MTALLDSLPAACRALVTEPEHLALVNGLEQRIPALREAIAALEALAISPSIVHGDFHPFNIAVDGTRPIFFDWTDSALSHPFIDLQTVILSPLFEDDPTAVPALIDAYLSAFRPHYPAETLAQAIALTRPVTALYMVISYVWIVEALAPRDRTDMRNGLVFWLKHLNEVVTPTSP
jgi:aminoglycoside phosphotransferase (APT) family kinase protein